MNIKTINKLKETDNEAVAIPIHERTGEPYYAPDGKTVTTFDVLGSESPTYKKRRDAAIKKAIAAGASGEDVEIAKAAAGVTGWKGVHSDGEPVEFTPENLAAALSAEHIRNQVNAGIGRYAGFFAKAS